MQPFKYRPRVNAGKMRRRIRVQEKKTITDREGIIKTEWVDIAAPWAARKPLTARWRETFQAAGVNAEKMVQFTIRYRTGITPDMRVIDTQGDQAYDIKAVLDDVYDDMTETWIMALERENG